MFGKNKKKDCRVGKATHNRKRTRKVFANAC